MLLEGFPYDPPIAKLLEHLHIDPGKLRLQGPGGKKFLILCCIPEHSDTHPSLRIDREYGYVKCYGCGFKGRLAALGKAIGLDLGTGKVEQDPDDDPFVIMAGKLVEQDKRMVDAAVKAPPNLRELPPAKRWRGMPVPFLQKFGAKAWFDPRSRVERIWFPCIQDGELVGWFGRVRSKADIEPHRQAALQSMQEYKRLERLPETSRAILDACAKHAEFTDSKLKAVINMKYRNNDQQRTDLILWPFDQVMSMAPTTVVLTEGQVDALWLIYQGIPAFAILGTRNFTAYKRSTLIGCGFDRIILAMDGDESGRKAQQDIYEQLYGYVKNIRRFKVPDGCDPATMPPDSLAKLRSLILPHLPANTNLRAVGQDDRDVLLPRQQVS